MGCKQTKSMDVSEPREIYCKLNIIPDINYKNTQLENYWHFSVKDNENDMENMANVSKKVGL